MRMCVHMPACLHIVSHTCRCMHAQVRTCAHPRAHRRTRGVTLSMPCVACSLRAQSRRDVTPHRAVPLCPSFG